MYLPINVSNMTVDENPKSCNNLLDDGIKITHGKEIISGEDPVFLILSDKSFAAANRDSCNSYTGQVNLLNPSLMDKSFGEDFCVSCDCGKNLWLLGGNV